MPAIAIDGPSGVGKSTLSRALAGALGYIYIDTGAMYRAVTLYALQNGIDPRDEASLVAALPGIRLSIRYQDGEQRIYLAGQDVSGEIRTPEVTNLVSYPSAMPEVRRYLVSLQREMAGSQDVIMDGRDIGTAVLPGAELKIFLKASDEERARRRYDEYIAKGVEVSYNDILRDIIRRDEIDSGRAASPLRAAADAVIVDTTPNTFEMSFGLLLGLIKEKLNLKD
jgi:cytidylate kinase